MSITIDLLNQRIEVLEKQIALLLLDKTSDTLIKKNSSNDLDTHKKKKRVSGYLLFSAAMRDDAKKHLFTDNVKPLNSLIMVELGKRWKALTYEQRLHWNNNAKSYT